MEILGQVGRQAFMGFVRRARSQTNRLESAKELKKLVFFSNMVIAPLVEDLQVCMVLRQKTHQQQHPSHLLPANSLPTAHSLWMQKPKRRKKQ